jgi:hypothetical protein
MNEKAAMNFLARNNAIQTVFGHPPTASKAQRLPQANHVASKSYRVVHLLSDRLAVIRRFGKTTHNQTKISLSVDTPARLLFNKTNVTEETALAQTRWTKPHWHIDKPAKPTKQIGCRASYTSDIQITLVGDLDQGVTASAAVHRSYRCWNSKFLMTTSTSFPSVGPAWGVDE